jgi:hypothetical protein
MDPNSISPDDLSYVTNHSNLVEILVSKAPYDATSTPAWFSCILVEVEDPTNGMPRQWFTKCCASMNHDSADITDDGRVSAIMGLETLLIATSQSYGIPPNTLLQSLELAIAKYAGGV